MKHRPRLETYNEGLRMIVIIEHRSSEFCQLINLVLENVLKLFQCLTRIGESMIDEPSPGERSCLVFVFL